MSTNPPGNDEGTPIHDRTAAEGHEIHPGVSVPSWAETTPLDRGAQDSHPLVGAGSADTTSGSSDGGSGSGKADAAKGAAQDVAGDAKDKASHVAGTAKEQASNVASEATDHAKALYGEASETLKQQAGEQQQKAASGLRAIGDQLGAMADNDEEQGIGARVVRDLSSRAGSVAGFLEGRDPGSLLDEVKSYAARKPGTFIALAAGAGILAGRLTKALTAEVKHEHQADAAHTGSAGTGAAHAPGTGTSATGPAGTSTTGPADPYTTDTTTGTTFPGTGTGA